MLAAAGAGLHPDARTASLEMAGPRVEPVNPDPGRRQRYDELHARHRQLYDALRPLF
jgi:ribulose kinase